MNFLKRAIKSIWRQRGKTLILLLLVFVLGTVVASAISVQSAINNTVDNLNASMAPIIGIDTVHPQTEEDWELIIEEWFGGMSEAEIEQFREDRGMWVTSDIVRTIGALPQVRWYDYVMQRWMGSFELLQYSSLYQDFWRDPDMISVLALTGSSRPEIQHFEQGVVELVSGRTFESSELMWNSNSEQTVAIVSDAWAELNDLSLGSTFTLYEFVHLPVEDDPWFDDVTFYDEDLYAKIRVEFEIIGIFTLGEEKIENPHTNDQWTLQMLQENMLNRIFIPNWVIESVNIQFFEANRSRWDAVDFVTSMSEWDLTQEAHYTQTFAFFLLNGAREIDDFKEAGSNYLPIFNEFSDFSSSFAPLTTSMETMEGVANLTLYASIGATLLILGLLTVLFLNDRRHEIGTYLALGEKKKKIVIQLLLEVIVVSFVGITLAVFAGNIMANIISHNMLVEQLSQSTQANTSDNFRFTSGSFDQLGITIPSMTEEEMIGAFEVSLNAESIGLFYAVGLGTVVLSTAAPMLYVVKLNPKKVLM